MFISFSVRCFIKPKSQTWVNTTDQGNRQRDGRWIVPSLPFVLPTIRSWRGEPSLTIITHYTYRNVAQKFVTIIIFLSLILTLMEDLLSVFSFFCTNIFSSVKVSFCLWPYKLTSQGKLKQISESALLCNIFFSVSRRRGTPRPRPGPLSFRINRYYR